MAREQAEGGPLPVWEIETFPYGESARDRTHFGRNDALPVQFLEIADAGSGARTGAFPPNAAFGDGSGFSSLSEMGYREFAPDAGHAGIEAADQKDAPDAMEPSDAEETSFDARQEMADEQIFQQLLAVETGKAEERGRSKGIELGLTLGREEAARRLEGERGRLAAQSAAMAASFAASRESYFHRLEQETARLALAIAARILRREAQADPLLLTGAVRVALGQLAASTVVRLHIPAQDQPLWEEALRHLPGLAIRPEVVGEAGMELGDCRMETGLGSADLGLWPQWKAIERGFFDRAADRAQDWGEDGGQDRPEAPRQAPQGSQEPEFEGLAGSPSAARIDVVQTGEGHGK